MPSATSATSTSEDNSVRVNDVFMAAVIADGTYTTKAVKNGADVKTYMARDVMRKIAEATWHCGDPGAQLDTTINAWDTSKATGRINSSNPCSEYMFLDDSACNLASLNLIKFLDADGSFQVDAFRAAVSTFIIAHRSEDRRV